MKKNILIVFLLLLLKVCYNNLFLSFESLTSGYMKHTLELDNEINFKNISDFFYIGSIEDYEKIILNSDNLENIKKEKHPLVSLTKTCTFTNIKYFSTDSIFVTPSYCINNITNYLSYSDYTFYLTTMDEEYINIIQNSKYFYVKIGKELDTDLIIILVVIFVFNLIAGIICIVIIRRKIKNLTFLNFLPIYSLIYNLYYTLMSVNIFNLFIILLGSPALDLVFEYIFLFLKAFSKGLLFSCVLLILKGWMIINFTEGVKFKKYIKYLVLYDFVISIIINLSFYFVVITSKLHLYYFKSGLEQIALFSYIIFCTKKRLLPLYKQMKYEERKRSNLLECLTFKYTKLKRIYLLFGIFSIIIFISPFIEYQIISLYFYNHFYHYVFISLYELTFCAFLNFIFISKNLPLYYFNEIIYNYIGILCLFAEIIEGDNKNKCNISNLTSAELKKSLKKEKYPILLINPFSSGKDPLLFNKMHLGITQGH